MKSLIFKSSKKRVHELLRAITYASSISTIFLVLILCRHEELPNIFKLFSFFGLILIIIESVFTVYDIDSVIYKETGFKISKKSNLISHSFNHLFYPIAFYIGLSLYIRFVTDLFIAIFLSFLSFILYLIYFINLRKHLHRDHIDAQASKKSSYKVDLIFNFFKLFSYFIINLAIFQLYSQLKININVVFAIICALNFGFLVFHINRKHEMLFINIIMALLFSIITSLFVIQAKTSVLNFTAGISTVIFYLSSGIFYHKVDGTLSYKVLIEYASIATIVSIFLFSF